MIRKASVALLMLLIAIGIVAVADETISTTRPRAFCLPILPKVHITEICVIPPPGKNWPAWIELWNNANTNVDLTGYSLATLQTTYRPFPDNTVLRPNARLVVLFYAGDKKDEDFEKKIPVAVQRVRVFSTTVFPPCMSQQQWISTLSDSFKESVTNSLRALAPDERDASLAALASLNIGSTRFANEVALRTQGGDLVGYVMWGNRQQLDWAATKKYTPTSANEEAIKKGFCIEWNVPQVFNGGDSKCVVLQLLAPLSVVGDPEHEQFKTRRQNLSGLYFPLTRPEVNCSPGTAMHLDVRAPELLPVEPCSVADGLGGRSILLRIGFVDGITDQVFERALGWTCEVCEICYDREMRRPVFKPDINRFKSPIESYLSVPLRPSVYRQLEGKTLYVRASKRHKQKGVLYSSVLEVKISHDGREPIPQDSSGTNSVPGMAELADGGANAEPQAGQVETPETQSGATDEAERLP